MKNLIYLEPDEGVGSIIKKINKCREKDIKLVIPAQSDIFIKQNLTDFYNQIKNADKKISLVSNDSTGLFLAKEIGFNISTDYSSKKQTKTLPSKSIKIVYKKGAKPETKQEKTIPAKPISIPVKEKKSKKAKPASLFSQILFASISIISIIIILSVILLVVPKTDIVITTQIENIPINQNITLDSNQQNIDLINNIIPAQTIEIEEKIVQEARATGETNIGQKATGVITVQNGSSGDIPLVGNTRFVTEDGILFRSTNSVNIPAGGSANVSVTSDLPGTIGNIGPSRFTLPALPGSENYIYGSSSSAMSGGTDDVLYTITPDDIQFSTQEISDKLLKQAINDLKTKLPSDRTYISPDPSTFNLSINPDHQVGDQTELFNIIATAKIPFLVYNIQDLKQITENQVSKIVSSNRNAIIDTTDKMDTKIVSMDLAAQKAYINLISNAISTPIYDIENIKKDLAGKSSEEVKEYFLAYPEIQQIDISFWPDWVKRVSKLPSRINIQIVW